MHSMAVASESITIESMFRPRTTVTAVWYLVAVGLQRSMTRPCTPGREKSAGQLRSQKMKSEMRRRLTREEALQI